VREIVKKQTPHGIRESLAASNSEVNADSRYTDSRVTAAASRGKDKKQPEDLGWWGLVRYWFEEFVWRRRYWHSLSMRAREGEREGRRP
jgi:hypothetical protein